MLMSFEHKSSSLPQLIVLSTTRPTTYSVKAIIELLVLTIVIAYVGGFSIGEMRRCCGNGCSFQIKTPCEVKSISCIEDGVYG